MTTSKHAFTAGPAITFPDAPFEVVMNDAEGVHALIATVATDNTGPPQALADAELIAEAFTVAHETGLTPRQLAARCKELEAAAAPLAEMLDGFPIGLPDQFEITVKVDATLCARFTIGQLRALRAVIAKTGGAA